jgi:hypothetical protein
VVDIGTAVDVDSALLAFNLTHQSVTPQNGQVIGVLEGPSTVRFSRYSPGNPMDVSIRWQVAQLPGAVVQRGLRELDTPGGVWTVPLTAPVAIDRAFAVVSLMTSGLTYGHNDWVLASFDDAQTLALASGWTGTTSTVAWQVVELPSVGAHVEHGEARLEAGVLGVTRALSVNAPLDRAFMLFTQAPDGSGNNAASDHLVRGRMLSATEVAFDRETAGVGISIGWSVIQWDALRVRRGDLHFATDVLEQAVPLAPPALVAASLTLLPGAFRQGKAALTTDDAVGVGWFTTELRPLGDELRVRRGSGLAPADARWVLVEFR